MGMYGDFDFDIMAVEKERKHALRYMRFLVLPFPGKFLLYGVKIDLFFLKKEYNIEEYTNLIPGIFLACITWIIHGLSLPDRHASLATTMLFKIYVVGREAQGMRLWFFTANGL
jgi:hypothetical protein